MKLKNIKAKISYMLCAMLLLTTGCGKEAMEAPELQKPVAVNESYRPVEMGNVGDIEIRDGVVVPTDYCHFYLTTVKVSEVKVEVGDYVEAGTVIVEADSEGATEQISSLSGQKSLNYNAWDINCKIYEQNKKELEYKIKGAVKEKADAQIALSYTLGDAYTMEYWMDIAKRIEDMGATSICLKDMANLLLPLKAYELVKALKLALKPTTKIHVHTHNTTGTGDMVYLMAILAGADIVDTALSPLGNGTSQPATEPLVATLKGTPLDTGIDIEDTTYFKE